MTGPVPSVLSLAVWTVPALMVRLVKVLKLLARTNVPGPIFVNGPGPVMGPLAVSVVAADSTWMVPPLVVRAIGLIVVAASSRRRKTCRRRG